MQAKQGNIDSSLETIKLIKMGIPYYQAVVRSDISPILFHSNRINKFMCRTRTNSVRLRKKMHYDYYRR